MRSRLIVVSAVILGSALGCGEGGVRLARDGSSDGKIVDGRATASEAGRLGMDSGSEVADARVGIETGLDALDVRNPIPDGALPLPDSGTPPPDGPLVSHDAVLLPHLDSGLADAPMVDAPVRLPDGGVPADSASDRPVEAALPAPDLGGVIPPDATVDAAHDAGLDLPPPSLPCNVPECWAALMHDCQPAGSCVVQSAAGYENQCFANSVKVLASFDEAAGKMVTTVMKGNQTCYQLDWDLAGGAAGGATSTGLIKNGSGATVATISDDGSGYSVITCTGAQPVVLSEGCDFVGQAVCEAGACGL